MPQPLLDRHSLVAAPNQWDFGQLAHIFYEKQGGASDVNFVVGRQAPFVIEAITVHPRAVEAVEVVEAPAAVGKVDLGVLPAAQVVLENNVVGVSPAQGVTLARLQREHVAETVFPSNHQIDRCAVSHLAAVEVMDHDVTTVTFTIAARGRFRQGESC